MRASLALSVLAIAASAVAQGPGLVRAPRLDIAGGDATGPSFQVDSPLKPGAEGLVDVADTTISVDRSRELLDSGSLVVHITRKDDLFSTKDLPSPDHPAIPYIERLTHVLLKVQIDSEKGTLNVNDEGVSLLEDGGDKVGRDLQVVKAETLSIPPSSLLSPASLLLNPNAINDLKENLSVGLVSAQIKVVGEEVPVGVMGVATPEVEDDGQLRDIKIQKVGDVKMRRVGVFVKITEVEGHSLPHETTVFTPILQLLIHHTSGNKVTQIRTLSIDGQQPLDQVPEVPRPVIAELPPVRWEAIGQKVPENKNEEGFMSRLGRFMGLRPHRPSPPSDASDCGKKSAKGSLASHIRPDFDRMLPFGGKKMRMGDIREALVNQRFEGGEGQVKDLSEGGDSDEHDSAPSVPGRFRHGHGLHGRKGPHHHGHHGHHSRFGCFARRFRLGVSYVFHKLGAWTLAVLSIPLLRTVFIWVFLMVLIRSIKKAAARRRERRREGLITLPVSEDGRESVGGDLEEVKVVSEDGASAAVENEKVLPAYEEIGKPAVVDVVVEKSHDEAEQK